MSMNEPQLSLFEEDGPPTIEQPVLLVVTYRLDGIDTHYTRQYRLHGEFDGADLEWSHARHRWDNYTLVQEAAWLYRQIGSVHARLSPF